VFTWDYGVKLATGCKERESKELVSTLGQAGEADKIRVSFGR